MANESRDDTETSQAENIPFLEDRERFFRNAFEHAAIGMALVAPTGRFLDVNASLCRMLGYTKEELVASDFQSITHPDDLHLDLEYVRQMLAGKIETYQMEKRYRHKLGETVIVLLSVSLIRDEVGAPTVFISQIQDITEKRRIEDQHRTLSMQIQNAQKLESLSVLAGGIAHDFNNLLVGILGNASLALEELAATHEIAGYLRDIETAALRAADLTRQMLAYSGKGKFVVQRFSLSALTEEMVNLLRASISKSVTLHCDFPTDLPAIEADATQIRQIVMNLITNGSEAIRGSHGVVGIRTGVVDVDEQYLATTFLNDGLTPGTYVYLEVSDNGCGMNDSTQKRIFDPFFTTKATGRGLGLAAVLGIVRGHRGAIKCYSETGKGTTFKVLFPACKGTVHSQPLAAPDPNMERGHRLILVVDDEPSVREVAARMLQRRGFEVECASNGVEAVDTYRQRRAEICLVLLDMMMPGLSGEETFRQLRAIDPHVRVILSSGYNEQDATSRFVGKGLAGFVHKPYRVGELWEAIRAALKATT
jgi:PAS domain S-box-containing protein